MINILAVVSESSGPSWSYWVALLTLIGLGLYVFWLFVGRLDELLQTFGKVSSTADPVRALEYRISELEKLSRSTQLISQAHLQRKNRALLAVAILVIWFASLFSSIPKCLEYSKQFVAMVSLDSKGKNAPAEGTAASGNDGEKKDDRSVVDKVETASSEISPRSAVGLIVFVFLASLFSVGPIVLGLALGKWVLDER